MGTAIQPELAPCALSLPLKRSLSAGDAELPPAALDQSPARIGPAVLLPLAVLAAAGAAGYGWWGQRQRQRRRYPCPSQNGGETSILLCARQGGWADAGFGAEVPDVELAGASATPSSWGSSRRVRLEAQLTMGLSMNTSSGCYCAVPLMRLSDVAQLHELVHQLGPPPPQPASLPSSQSVPDLGLREAPASASAAGPASAAPGAAGGASDTWLTCASWQWGLPTDSMRMQPEELEVSEGCADQARQVLLGRL